MALRLRPVRPRRWRESIWTRRQSISSSYAPTERSTPDFRRGPGAAAFVVLVRTRARLALVTLSPRGRVDAALSLASLSDAFETIVTADDVLNQKPDPEGIRLALQRLARRRPIGPGSVIALEGTREGIRAARHAGIRVIAVGAVPAHVAVDADGYLGSLEDATVERLDAIARPDGGARIE
jgi:mannitol-1-/sugar-/sorbitol-6-phosphatase